MKTPHIRIVIKFTQTQEHFDIPASNYWLTSGRLFPKTEGFLLAIQEIQDQATKDEQPITQEKKNTEHLILRAQSP